jgi:hypothetical protein
MMTAIREASRACAKPTVSDLKMVKHIIRYLEGTTRYGLEVTYVKPVDGQAEELIVTTDAAWGSSRGRRSVSGGVLQYQGITLAIWSRTQPTVAHSSCEAELVALHTGIQEAKFARSVLADMGEVTIRVVTDSASSIKVAMRRGLGRLKYFELKYFGLQEDPRRGELTVTYVPSEDNIVDLLTKRL